METYFLSRIGHQNGQCPKYNYRGTSSRVFRSDINTVLNILPGIAKFVNFQKAEFLD